MNIFLSTIQVLHPGNGDLILNFPVQYLLSIPLAIVGCLFALFFGLLIKQNGFRFSSLLMLLAFIPLGLFVYVATQSSSVVFSRESNRMVIKEHLFFRTTTTTYPLSNVNHAEVALDDGHSHMFYLAMNTGERIPIGGGWTPRKGYYQAADAVNQFVSHPFGIERKSGNSPQPPALDFDKKLQEARKAFVEQSEKSQPLSKQ